MFTFINITRTIILMLFYSTFLPACFCIPRQNYLYYCESDKDCNKPFSCAKKPYYWIFKKKWYYAREDNPDSADFYQRNLETGFLEPSYAEIAGNFTSHDEYVWGRIHKYIFSHLKKQQGAENEVNVECVYPKMMLKLSNIIHGKIPEKNIASYAQIIININEQSAPLIIQHVYDHAYISYAYESIKCNYTYNQVRTKFLPHYCFYSPYALGYLISFESIIDAKISWYIENCENTDLVHALYLDYLMNYFYNANKKILSNLTIKNIQIMASKSSDILDRYDFLMQDVNFYNVMISTYNIEILYHFINPHLYTMLVRFTNFTTKKIYKNGMKANEENMIYFYLVIFSMFFIDDKFAKLLANECYSDDSMNLYYKNITKQLISDLGPKNFTESDAFAIFFVQILESKILRFMKTYVTSMQDISDVAFLEDALKSWISERFEITEQNILPGLYTTNTNLNAEDHKIKDETFYKLFLYTMIDILVNNMIQNQNK